MMYSRSVYIGDGVTTSFPLAFTLGYLDRAHIKCRVGDEQYADGSPRYRPILWDTTQEGFITVSGDVPKKGELVVLTRTVPKGRLLHDFIRGSNLTEKALGETNKQLLMAIHEIIDRLNLGDDTEELETTTREIITKYFQNMDIVVEVTTSEHVSPSAYFVLYEDGTERLVLTIPVPKGEKGEKGDPGDKGEKGDTGKTGPQGTPPVIGVIDCGYADSVPIYRIDGGNASGVYVPHNKYSNKDE